MHNRVQLFLTTSLTLLGILFLAAPQVVLADVPDLINYQGVLTDASGNPVADGNYSVTLSIYSSAIGGVALWSETKNVTTTNGLYNTRLGSVTPLSSSVFSGTNRFLGTTVSPDPEMIPRTEITTVPYAYRIATVDGAAGGSITGDVDVSSNSVGNALSVTQSGGGRGGLFQIANGANTEAAVQGTHVGPGAGGSFFSDGGGPGIRASATGGTAAELEGRVNTYGDITAFDGVDPAFEVDVTASQISTFGSDGLEQIRLWGVGFGELLLNDNTGNNQTAKLSATSNSGGQLTLGDATGVTEIFLNGGGSGDASVQLPVDAINSDEIVDEPGIANRIQGAAVFLTSGLDSAILVRTITAPVDGYVIAFATAYVDFGHAMGSFSGITFGVVPPGGTLGSAPTVSGQISGNAPGGSYRMPISVTAAFDVSAGANQFSLEVDNFGGNILSVANSQLTLLYVPTAYGLVTSNEANGADDEPDTRESELSKSTQFDSQRIETELAALREKLDALQSQVEENGQVE